MDAYYYVMIIGAVIKFSVWFSIGWFLCYVVAGSWLKVKLVRLKLHTPDEIPKRYGPAALSHILFSVLFVNPWVLFVVLMYVRAGDNLDSILRILVVIAVYLWPFSTGMDYLVMRLLPKWSRLKRLRYVVGFKRLALANLVVVLAATGAGFIFTIVPGVLEQAEQSAGVAGTAYEPALTVGGNRIMLGKAFPDLEFESLAGDTINIGQMKGKVVLIDFWASWCGPCVYEMPAVVSIYEEYHGKGFEIVGISLDGDRSALERFMKSQGMKWPQYYDGRGWDNRVSSHFGINSIPATVLLDREGIVRYKGLRSGQLREAVPLLLEK